MAKSVKRPLQSSYPIPCTTKFRRWYVTQGRRKAKNYNPRLYLFPVPLSATITDAVIFSQTKLTPGQPLATGLSRR